MLQVAIFTHKFAEIILQSICHPCNHANFYHSWMCTCQTHFRSRLDVSGCAWEGQRSFCPCTAAWSHCRHWLDSKMDLIKDALFGDLKRMDARQVSDFTCLSLRELTNLSLNFNWTVCNNWSLTSSRETSSVPKTFTSTYGVEKRSGWITYPWHRSTDFANFDPPIL